MDTSQRHLNAVPKESLHFFWADRSKEGGFAVVRAGESILTLEFLDAHGSMLYSRNLYPRDPYKL